MKHKSILLLVFLFVSFLQLLVPANMIYQKNKTVASGKIYKFKVKPVDPADPFMGRYVDLHFDQDTFLVENDTIYIDNREIYVEIDAGLDSFAIIKNISLKPFDHTDSYLKAKVEYVHDGRIHILYPFNRFYMEETKAPEAESYANRMLRDSTYLGYAEVHVYKGDSVLKDVKINDKTFRAL